MMGMPEINPMFFEIALTLARIELEDLGIEIIPILYNNAGDSASNPNRCTGAVESNRLDRIVESIWAYPI